MSRDPIHRIFIAALLAAAFAAAPAAAGPPEPPASAGNPVVLIDTTLGAITVELQADRAPATVRNFLSYVEKGHYNATIFHRVINNFMIQGGGFEMDGRAKPTDPPIRNESGNGLTNKRGTIAMARTRAPDSATAQFFINVVDNAMLDRENSSDQVGYAVFGRVIEGMNVVDRIRAVPTRRTAISEAQPVEPVIIKSVRRIR